MKVEKKIKFIFLKKYSSQSVFIKKLKIPSKSRKKNQIYFLKNTLPNQFSLKSWKFRVKVEK